MLTTEVLQTSSFQFSVGSIHGKKRGFLKTENQKLYTSGKTGYNLYANTKVV